MYFSKVALKNFGPFSDAQFDFEKQSLNWIVGYNGSGKTQLVGALAAAIIGRPALSVTTGGVGPSSVTLDVGAGDIQETIGLKVKESPKGKVEVSKATGPLMLQALAELSGPSNQRLMMGYPREAVLASVNFHSMERFLSDPIKAHPWWADMLGQSGRRRYIGSTAQTYAAELISQLVSRRLARFKLPLILDDIFGFWPRDEYDFLFKILAEIAHESQVFLTSSLRPVIEVAPGSVVQVSSTRGAVSLASFNSWFDTREPNFRPQQKSKWIKDAQYPNQENRACEFKEVKGGNPLGAIKGLVDQYVVAFMNAGVAQEGSIFWGVRDTDRAIVGVQLRPRDCDELRRIVTERLHQIVPPIAPTAYRIELHQVTNGSTVIDDLYVVEVRVPAVRRTLLFATGGQEVYVKTDAGKRKLSVLELQQELIQRLGVDPGL